MNAETDPWADGTYDGVRAAQAADVAALTPLQRLRWLDGAIAFAAATGALTVRRRAAQAAADAVWANAGGRTADGHGAGDGA